MNSIFTEENLLAFTTAARFGLIPFLRALRRECASA